MKHRIVLITIFSFIICHASFAMSKQEAGALITKADSAYTKSEWQSAYDKYSAAEAEWNSFDLQFNLGNACFRLNKMGEAILHYERAKKINPSDEDLMTNLQIANSKVPDKIEALPTLGVDDLWKRITAEGSLTTWSLCTIGLLFLGAVMVGWYVWRRKYSPSRSLLLGGIFVMILSFVFYGFGQSTLSRIHGNTEAVVLTAKVDVKTSPSDNSSTAFVLHEGTKVTIREENDLWIEVRIASGSLGWMKKSELAVI